MGEAKFFYLEFLSEKFSSPTERVTFSTEGLKHKDLTQHISRAPNSFNNMSRRKSGYCDTQKLPIFETDSGRCAVGARLR